MQMIGAILFVLGAFFIFVASLGILTMPDLYTRMQASTKACTVGTGLILLGVGFHFEHWAVFVTTIVISFFLFITAPVGAHMVALIARRLNYDVWDKTQLDEESQAHFRQETR